MEGSQFFCFPFLLLVLLNNCQLLFQLSPVSVFGGHPVFSISLTSNSNSEGEGHQFRNSRSFTSKRKPRSSSVHLGRNSRSSIRSASTTSIEHTSIRSASSGRMSRGAERERLKLERMMNGSYMRSLTPKRSRSQDILDTRVVKSELKVLNMS